MLFSSTVQDILNQYFYKNELAVVEKKGGMNNTTFTVEDGQIRYILRVYKAHTDQKKVQFEHTVLKALHSLDLPFQTPKPVQTLNGSDYAVAADGTVGILFHYIDGANPENGSNIRFDDKGRAVGYLSRAFKDIHVNADCAYSKYYELEYAYTDCPVSDVIAFCLSPDESFLPHQAALQEIAFRLERYREVKPKLIKLPHQLIHGDIGSSNILIDPSGSLTAILDFEFVTVDLRVMELAVCLSEILSWYEGKLMEHECLNSIQSFLSGFSQAVKLMPEEKEVIAELMMLRRLDVFIHFLNRYRKGIHSGGMDAIDVVKWQLENTYAQSLWLRRNESVVLLQLG